MKSPDYFFSSIDSDLIAERLNKLIMAKKEYQENVLCYTENQWRKILGISSHENIGIAALFCWGLTKGIYDFDTQLIGELCVAGTEELDKFPEILNHLPQQCIYLKLTKIAGGPLEFWALRLRDKLLLVQNHSDGTDPSVHQLNISNTTSFTQAIEEYRCSIAAQWADTPDAQIKSVDFSYLILLMVKAVAYLCTANRDVVEASYGHEILRNPEPVAAEPIFQNGEWRLNFADKTRIWKVGDTIKDRLTAEVAVSISHWHQAKNGSYQWLFGRDSKREHVEPEDCEELPEIDLTKNDRPRLSPEKLAAMMQRDFDMRPGAPKVSE